MKHLKTTASLFLFIALILAMIYLTGVLTETLNAEDRYQWNLSPKTAQHKNGPGIYVIGEPVDIRSLPEEVINDHKKQSRYIFIDEDYDSIYEDSNEIWHKIQYDDYPITHIQFSPLTREWLGFLYHPTTEVYYDAALVIMNINTRETKEVYRRDIRTSTWEWDGPDKVIVYYNCGSSCLYAYKIDILTGKTVDEYHIPIPTVTTPIYTPGV